MYTIIGGFFSYLFCALVMHSLLDFPLQGDATAVNKNPNAKTPLQAHVPWFYWMGSHALLHGGGVALVTNSMFLGVLETIAHFFIDLGKCNGKYSIHVDQLLHVGCKVLWITILLFLR